MADPLIISHYCWPTKYSGGKVGPHHSYFVSMHLFWNSLNDNKEFWLKPDSSHLSSLGHIVLPPQLLFSFGTFDSFLAGLDRNWVYGVCCSAQMAHKSVQTSSAKQATDAKSLLSLIWIMCSLRYYSFQMTTGSLTLRLVVASPSVGSSQFERPWLHNQTLINYKYILVQYHHSFIKYILV